MNGKEVIKVAKKEKMITVRLAELTKQVVVSRVKSGTTLIDFLEKNGLSYSSAVRVNAETAGKIYKLHNGDIITVIGQVSGGK